MTSSRIDEIDRQILRELADDARLSHREVARRVGMSPGAVHQRVERMEQLGVIKGYHAEIDPEWLGFSTRALIGLQVAQGGTVSETTEQLRSIPEVVSVSLVTGSWDFVVELLVRDQEHLRAALVGEVWRLPIFRHSETMVVLEYAKRTGSSVGLVAPPPAP